MNLYENNLLFELNYKILDFFPVKFHHFRFGPFLQPDNIFLDSINLLFLPISCLLQI